QFRSAAPRRRNQVDFPGTADRQVQKRDLRTVRRPMWSERSDRRKRKLYFLGSIRPASPMNHVRIGDVSYPLPIGRKIDCPRRDAFEIRIEVTGLEVVTEQFYATLLAKDK